MKFSRNILFVVSIILVWKFCSAALDENYEQFKNLFSRNNQNSIEDISRQKVFRYTNSKISRHNREYEEGRHFYKMGHNQFSDRYPEELEQFSMKVNNNNHTSHQCNRNRLPVPPTAASVYLNWISHGWNTPVLDQGACNCGYAFSTVGAIEAAFHLKKGLPWKFSEQDIIDCSTDYGTDGCYGGYLSATFTYITKRGISLNEFYPFIEKRNSGCLKYGKQTKLESYHCLHEQSEDTLKNYVAAYGPIAVSFNVNDNFKYYSEGIYYDRDCDRNVQNHALIIVGYGTTAGGIDYWIVKNSFGEKWGTLGYALISRNVNQCGIANEAFVPHI